MEVRAGRGRRLRGWAAALLAPVVALSVAATGAPAAATWGHGGGGGGEKKLTIVVRKGGDRTANGVSGLAGATFGFYKVGSSHALSGGSDTGKTCTTDASGQCSVQVPLSWGDNYFYARELQAPAGWTAAETWGDDDDLVRYNTGRISSYHGNQTVTLPSSSRRWPDVRTNPTAPQRCGLDLSMVFDVSGSIDRRELEMFHDAAKSAVDALANTPSRVALHKFATHASTVRGLAPVSSVEEADQVKDAIDGIDGDGWTNWDRALWQSVDPDYDVVLMLTDGDPTTYGNGSDASNQIKLRYVEEAIHSANAVKAAGSQVIAVGIGMSGEASIQRLNLISSPGSTYTTTWQQLGEKLKEIAGGPCDQQVTVRKVVQDSEGNELTGSPLANGWSFTGSTSAGTLGSFPATAAVNGQNGFTSARLSLAAGRAATISLTEDLQQGWSFVGAECTVDGASVPVTPGAQEGSFSFRGVGNKPIACEVTNRQEPTYADLTVTKTAEPSYARDYDWSVAKTVLNGTSHQVGAGETAAVDYAVTVTPSAPVDSGFRVAGTITVVNPNEITFTDVDVADTIPGATCQLQGGGQDRTFAPGTTTIDYTCSLSSATAATQGTNSVALTWDADAVRGTTGSAAAQAGFDFADATPTVTDATALVTDSMVDLDGRGPDGVVVSAADGPRTFTYTRELAGAEDACVTHDNTATVRPVDSQTPGQAMASVTVCSQTPEVLEQSAGKATGKLRVSCQGTARAKARNFSDERVRYVLKVGKKKRVFKVAPGAKKVVRAKGKPRVRVVLKAQGKVVARKRMPKRCLPPTVLPQTGVRATGGHREATPWRRR